MKRIDWLFFIVSRRTMMLVSIFLILYGILMLASSTVGLPKAFTDGTIHIAIPDLHKEVPIDAHVWANIPDSSIAVHAQNGTRVINFEPEFALYDGVREDLELIDVYKDTIRNVVSKGKPDWDIKRLTINSGVLYVQPSGFNQRMLLSILPILWCFVAGLCLWQLSKILKAIAEHEFFASHVPQRMSMIGWSIIAYQLACIIITIINYPYHSVTLEVSSSIPNYRAPFHISGFPENDYSITWLIAGAIILVFARAFKKGQVLQKDYDLQV